MSHGHILVDGAWSGWTDYGTCSESCGPGTKNRTRACDNPAAVYGGAPCPGESVQNMDCEITPCPGRCMLYTLMFVIC